MVKISDEFSEYISQISLNFMKYTYNLAGLAIAEASRQKNIRLELIILMKLYKGMELTERENEIINKHLLQYDYNTDLKRCVYQIVYQISDKTWVKVEQIKKDKVRFMNNNMMAIYREYMRVLKQYTDSILHAMCFNHQLILINPINNQEVCPVMNFDSECVIERKSVFTKKKTLN